MSKPHTIRHYRCFRCKLTKTPDDFTYSTRYGRQSWCRECHKEYRQSYEGRNKRYQRYDLTPDEFDQMLEIQNGNCVICEKSLTIPQVDHDHDTNKVRGLLCNLCNTGLGALGDNIKGLQKAIRYLEKL